MWYTLPGVCPVAHGGRSPRGNATAAFVRGLGHLPWGPQLIVGVGTMRQLAAGLGAELEGELRVRPQAPQLR